LGAIRNQHYSAVDGSLWTSVGGPLAAMQVMTDLQQLLAPSGAQPTL
jgi:iron complex transport system substrate-binding protein